MKHLRTYLAVFCCILVMTGASSAAATEISNVQVSDLTKSSATIRWATDLITDATINYGLDDAVGLVRDPLFESKDHSLMITNLDPSTTYHFRVISADEQGNKSATAGFVFTTAGDVAEKINKQIDKITDPSQLEKVVEQVQQKAQDILRPPSIIGLPKVDPQSNSALITWTSDRASNSMVALASERDYRPNSSDPYAITQGNPRESTTKHSVKVIGLDPSTTYHFSVSSDDNAGLTGRSEDDTFQTKSILPVISHMQVSRVQEHSVNISWDTGDVLAKGTVEYTNLRTKQSKSTGSPIYAGKQNIQVAGLEFGTRYSAVIVATNQGGDKTTSNPFTFVTVRDVVPPQISKVKNESTLYPSEDTKIQTIISWETDEPTTCQVSYTQGLVHNDGDAGDALPAETNPLTLHTQVVVGFAPGTVYKFWMICDDVTGNESRSDDYVLITPIREKNIIDVILENFQGTFGWVSNIGK